MTTLSEQIAEYERKYPSVDIYAPPGTRVVFHGRGGYPNQKIAANQVMTVGNTYTLAGSSVGGWGATFFLEGVPGCHNSSMFSPEGWLPHDPL